MRKPDADAGDGVGGGIGGIVQMGSGAAVVGAGLGIAAAMHSNDSAQTPTNWMR
jgi:hypothetical protein